MRKKLALLLAMAMTISAFPASVFGNVVSPAPQGQGNYTAYSLNGYWPGQIKDGASSTWRTNEQRFVQDWKVAIDLSRHTPVATSPNVFTPSGPNNPILNLLVEIQNGTWSGVVDASTGWIPDTLINPATGRKMANGDLFWMDWPSATESRCLTNASFNSGIGIEEGTTTWVTDGLNADGSPRWVERVGIWEASGWNHVAPYGEDDWIPVEPWFRTDRGPIGANSGFARSGSLLPRAGAARTHTNAFAYDFTALSSTQGRLRIFDEQVPFWNPNETKWFALVEGIKIVPNSEDTTPTVTLINPDGSGHRVAPPHGILRRPRDLTVSVANPTTSNNFMYFDWLYISENNRGDFSYGRETTSVFPIVTIWTPSDYRWVRPAHASTQYNNHQIIGRHTSALYTGARDPFEYSTRHVQSGTGGRFVQLVWGGDSPWGWKHAHYVNHHASLPYGSGIPYLAPQAVVGTSSTAMSAAYNNRFLSIHLPLEHNEFAGAPAERIALRGLGLTVNNAADMGEVNLSYFVDWVQWSMDGSTERPEIVGSYIQTRVGTYWSVPGYVDGRRQDASKWKSFRAGSREEFDTSLSVSEVKDIRSGDQGLDSEYYFLLNRSTTIWDDTSLGTVNEWKESANNHWTGWVHLKENSVGSWGAGLGMDVTFHMPEHGGAIIMGAEVILPYTQFAGDDTIPYTTWTQDWEPGRYAPGHGEVGGWNFPDARGVLTTPNYVRITPAFQHWTERTSLREMRIRFLVSIEPGYEHKYGSDLEVLVTGSSLAHLYGNDTVVPARIFDPITVDMDFDTVIIEDNRAYNVASHELAEIVIRETNYGMLRKESELWVYVVGARANELEFTADPVAIVNTEDSGLKLTRGSILRHRWSNSWVNGMRWTVEERSFERASRNNPDLGEVVIVGGKVSGPVYPGVPSYEVVVSGSSVAANNYTVFENRRGSSTMTSYDLARNYSWRLFDAEPYAVEALAFEGDYLGEHEGPAIDDTEPGGPGSTHTSYTEKVSTSLTLNEWSPAIDGVKPFIMVQVNNQTRVGMVSPRVIAEFFGSAVNWDADTGTATISGKGVTVEFKVDSYTATVNGQEVAITNSAGVAMPVLSFKNSSGGDNFYLPAAFISSVFGIKVYWDIPTGTVTFYE